MLRTDSFYLFFFDLKKVFLFIQNWLMITQLAWAITQLENNGY